MQRTRTKFCGITRSQDALAAAAAGADAIGLIFYAKSSRYISIDQAKDILRILPPMVSPVGLFVNHSSDEIREIAKTLKLRTLQLHGDEPPEQLADLTDFTVIKAVRCDAQNLPTILQTWGAAALRWENLAGLLLETANTKDHGGTGIENDWATIESFAASQRSLPPLIAAGGLTPENVAAVIRRVRPYAVDVSTGIEESRGVKSVDKMRRFVEEARNADTKTPGQQ